MDQGSELGAGRRKSRVSEHTFRYVSILSRAATQPWALRRVFIMDFKIFQILTSDEKIRPVSESSCFLLIPAQCYEWNEGRWHGIG